MTSRFNQVTPSNISLSVIAALYGIIPACLMIHWADVYLFDKSVTQALPALPAGLFLFHLLFGTPHIIASSVIMFSNSDYRSWCKKRLWAIAVVIFAFLAACVVILPQEVAFVIVVFFSIAHLFNQQVGLANITCKFSGAAFRLWRWSGISVGVIVFCVIFIANLLPVSLIEWCHSSLIGLVVLFTLLSLFFHRHTKSARAKVFLWGNYFFVVTPWYLYLEGNYFFAILAPRVIHDVTAFYIYAVHDKNRDVSGEASGIIKFFRRLKINVIIATPLIGIALAYLIQDQLDPFINWAAVSFFDSKEPIAIAFGLVTFFNLLHYYTESFTWGKGSPYRRFIAFR